MNLDWEFGYGCNITCHQSLWSQVSKRLRAKGKELAISVDDSNAEAGWNSSWGNWSYETQWRYFLPYADVLINMGTCACHDPLINLPLWLSMIALHSSPQKQRSGSSIVDGVGNACCADPSTPRFRPAWQHLKPFPCPGNPQRTCGVEGQVIDMIKHGADPVSSKALAWQNLLRNDR